MSERNPGVFWSGAALVWRRQRVLWWVYFVHFALAYLAASIVTSRIATALDHSLAAPRLLVEGFHLPELLILGNLPQGYMDPSAAPFYFALVFFFFMLLATGGILETYWRDASPTTAEFFQFGGTYFWRFLRLLFFLALVLVPVGIVVGIGGHVADKIDQVSTSPFAWVWAQGAVFVVLVFLLLSVRLWFDLAEIIAVAECEVRSRKCLRRAAGVLRRNFGGLFWLYFRISLVASLIFYVGFHLWASHLPHDAIKRGFFLSQLIMLFSLGARYWQRASETLWYHNYLSRPPIA